MQTASTGTRTFHIHAAKLVGAAQPPSTTPAAEVSLAVEKDQIVERGPYEELLAQNSLPAHFHREQVAKAMLGEKEREGVEPAPRIFISSATSGDERGTEVARQLLHDLRVAGAEVVTTDATVAKEDFVIYLNQELPRCHYFLLVQTPLAWRSLHVQASLNVAFNLVAQQRMKAVLRLIAVPGEHPTEQVLWGKSRLFDASEDYASARDQLFLELGLLKPQEEPPVLVNQLQPVALFSPELPVLAGGSTDTRLLKPQEEPHTTQHNMIQVRKPGRRESRRLHHRTSSLRRPTQPGNGIRAPVQTEQRRAIKENDVSSTALLALPGDTGVHRSAHLKNRAIRYRITEEPEIFQPANQRPGEQSKRPPRRVHWLFPAGLGMLVMLALVAGGMSLTSWWNTYRLSTTYGLPPTWQTNQVVGVDHDSALHPSHFIFENLDGHVVFIDIPAGDITKAKIYSVATLHGDNVASVPVTATFADVNRNGKPDIFIHIGDQTIIYVNTGTGFQPQQ